MARHLIFAAATLLAVGPAVAELADPLYIANRNPFVAIYGLPGAESGYLPAADTLETGLFLDIANNWHPSRSGNEAVDLDGESYRGDLRLRFGVNERWATGFDLAYLRHNGGFADGLVDGFHDLFGMQDADRAKYSRGQLLYRYARDGVDQVRVDRDSQDFAEMRWSLGYQWLRDAHQGLALRAGVKLSLGDADELTGSQTTDLYASLNYSRLTSLWGSPLTWHISGGALWMDKAEVLDAIRRDWVAFGSGSVSWAVREWWHWKLQLDTHSAFYHSDKSQLGRPAAQLTLGATAALGRTWALDLGLVEDVAADTSPDVVFHFGLRRTYQ